MPNSRKRAGHHYQKPSAIPGKQRTKASTVCAILFAFFIGVISFFADAGYITILFFTLLGALIGYFVGKGMEKDARKLS
jgi:glycopeptide antibiotics resistance protein